MAEFTWSEVFSSIEGEARYSGETTVFVRFTGCNFSCRGFNNPTLTSVTNEVLGFDPSAYRTLEAMPTIQIGCDSIYSWDPRFKHVWIHGDEVELGRVIVDTLPAKSWVHPVSGRDVILCLTGGEPTLRTKTIPTLLSTPALAGVQRLLIETNGSITLPQEFLDRLTDWSTARAGRKVIWSNSPKLSASGEAWDDAIRPEVARAQRTVAGAEQYFKFVCGDDVAAFDEVAKAMAAYHEAGIPRDADVYIMPMACTEEQQQGVAAQVAARCMERGYIYCHRIHNSVFGNAVGT